MNTIKVILSESGRIADLKKDFPMYQGAFQNKLLNVLIPASILSPQLLTQYIGSDGFIKSENEAYTAVKIGMVSTQRNGKLSESQSYYMRFLKTLTYNGVEYFLYERMLPKEFTLFAGEGENAPVMVINAVNILNNVSHSENARGVTYATVNEPTVLSVITSQRCALDVLPSANFDTDEAVDPSELELLSGQVNALLAQMGNKSNRSETVLKYNVAQQLPVYVMYEKDGYKTVGVQFYNETYVVPTADGATESKTGAVFVNNYREDAQNPVIAYQDEIFVCTGGCLTRTITLNVSQSSIGQYTVVNIGAWQTVNVDWLNVLDADIADIKTTLDVLLANLNFGEYPVGSMTVTTLPTDDELNAFVQSQTGRATRLGDVIYVLYDVSGGADILYKYSYQGGQIIDGEVVGAVWRSIVVPGVVSAGNNEPGIVAGTNTAEYIAELLAGTRKVVADIVGGQIRDLLVLNPNTAEAVGLAEKAVLYDSADALNARLQAAYGKTAGNTRYDVYKTEPMTTAQAVAYNAANGTAETNASATVKLGDYNMPSFDIGKDKKKLRFYKNSAGTEVSDVYAMESDIGSYADLPESAASVVAAIVANFNRINAANGSIGAIKADIGDMNLPNSAADLSQALRNAADGQADNANAILANSANIAVIQADYVRKQDNVQPLVYSEDFTVNETGALIQTEKLKDIRGTTVTEVQKTAIPVSNDAARLFLVQEQETLQDLASWKASFNSAGLNYVADLSGVPAGDTSSEAVQTYLTNLYHTISGTTGEPLDQTTMTDETVGKTYKYYLTTKQWYVSRGSGVSVATNNMYNGSGQLISPGNVGYIVGSNLRYYAFVETNGEVTLNGMDELDRRVANNASAVTEEVAARQNAIASVQAQITAQDAKIAPAIKWRGDWSETVIYSQNDAVNGADGYLYLSLINDSAGNSPVGFEGIQNAYWRRMNYTTQKVKASVASSATKYYIVVTPTAGAGDAFLLNSENLYLNEQGELCDARGVLAAMSDITELSGQLAEKVSKGDGTSELANNGDGTLVNGVIDPYAKVSQLPTNVSDLGGADNYVQKDGDTMSGALTVIDRRTIGEWGWNIGKKISAIVNGSMYDVMEISAGTLYLGNLQEVLQFQGGLERASYNRKDLAFLSDIPAVPKIQNNGEAVSVLNFYIDADGYLNIDTGV